ncbi:N-acetyllactosaminide beta-1,3-N-acetylglucosaminyltransferase 2-like [Xyrauchen texanus]|uniref:N-acetyllactosaminide beta-1,3-N-acetylglucosaminyltransferase 2-like n=1 Tax=Xyrauchen texanus TaxID=154827 RepID=UPI0022427737|nr:N-acetyllactosaminide beta-1,3-N-acetylglucosaminyltransferase 2-like [Xyrauchen texanus]XP_052001708.1 N-acetyllactosaminide beta-1,3-N-acetylglucosaminyltransferase 2-like [Xyrauchen texanus]XP_052001709.1 N-acetyllactosaminide beta-1,3-N-acetylglucosaminyltransferase 2-like [Xyrauchen texanus]
MQGPRRKVKVMVTMTMVFIFIVVEVSRNAGKGDGNKNKLLIPSKRFWAKDAPSDAFWNRQQQQLNYINNRNLEYLNSTIKKVPDWFNDTVSLDTCEPDFRVTTQIKDYNSLPDRFKDFLLYMRCRSYPIVVDQPNICKDQPFLLLAIKSLVPHFDRRQAIRESWGKAGRLANKTVVTLFLLGNAATEDYFPDLSQMFNLECSMHGDIIQWDFRDTFFNLTIKEVLFLEWLTTRCSEASYIFKGDDDVFVNTVRIIDFLSNLSHAKAKELFVGDVITNAGPHRNKKVKYFIPESVYIGAYPAYAGGGGYLFSGQLAKKIYNASKQVALYPIDDVYTGMCLMKLGLAPEKHKGFRTFDIEDKYRDNACAYNSLMLVHPRSPQHMIKIWAWLNDPALNCQ